MARPFIFNGGDPGETPESVARRRAIADALLRQAMGGDSQPKSVMAAIGQGLGNLGEVLAYRRINGRADQAEKAGRASVGDLSSLFGGDSGGDASSGDTPAGGTGASGATAGSTPANAKDLANEFINLGYSPTQADGIVGNLVQESSLNPGIVGDHGISYGLGQWNGNRFAALKQFAAANGGQWSDPKIQVRFIDHELKSSEGQAHKRLMAAQTPEQAATAFIGYERPQGFTWDNPARGNGYANRVAHATRIAQMLGSGQPPTQVASLDPSAGMANAYPNTWDAPPVPGASPQPYASPIQGGDNDPTGLGQGQAMPPIQRVTQALQQAQGGAAPAAASPAVQRVAQAMSNRARTALQIMRNPWASPEEKAVAADFLKQEMEQRDPIHQLALRKAQLEVEQMEHPRPEYGFSSVGDDLIRTDKNAGTAIPVYQGKPKATGKEQDYEYYSAQEKAQGRQPLSFGEWDVRNSKAGASNINIGQSEYGTIPPGYALKKDPATGALSMEPIPGGPAAVEQQANDDKTAKQQKLAETYAGVVTEDIDRAIDGIDKANIPATGLTGWITQAIPGTPGYNVAQLLATVKANAGFDRLQQMREASPTGGALGNVSDFENRLLQATLGSLDQAQNKEQLVYNLNRVKKVYKAILTKGIQPGDPLVSEILGKGGGIGSALSMTGGVRSDDGWKVLPNGVKIRVKP